MKKLALLSLIVAASALAQQNRTTLISDPFVLKPKAGAVLPRISLQEPSVLDGGDFVAASKLLSIKGVSTAGNGIKRVDVNGLILVPSDVGGFSGKIPLRNGPNQITVIAEDNSGNQGKISFVAYYDMKPPVIDVIQPKVAGQRGVRNVVVDTTVLIARVYDDCLLTDVTVNGASVQVGPDSLIRTQLSLRDTPDTVRIVATDVAGHSSLWELPLSFRPRAIPPDFLSGRSYAIVIGIDSYTGIWPRLKNAANDARAVARLLTTQFKFERVDSLINEKATRSNILQMIETVGRTIRPEDRLLIYYSGHGRKEPPYNKGYWVPVDATERSIGQYISNRDIQDYMAGMNARHVLLVADACFAADIFKGGALREDFEDTPNYYRHIAGIRSRKAMTSGGDEPVMDEGAPGHSIFAGYFIKALQGIQKPYFSAWEVFKSLRIPVANNSDQEPQFDAVKNTGDEGGEFLFVRR